MSNKPPSSNRTVPLSSLPPCAGGSSRRDFCIGAGAGLIALGLTGCGSAGNGMGRDAAVGDAGTDAATTGSGTCASSTVSGGAASAIAVGMAQHLTGGGNSIFLCRDAGGLYAMDAACTHEGQLLTKQATRFWCSRHGATFDLNGEHPTSPAGSPLDHYAVCIDASGNVSIDTNEIVAATIRV